MDAPKTDKRLLMASACMLTLAFLVATWFPYRSGRRMPAPQPVASEVAERNHAEAAASEPPAVGESPAPDRVAQPEEQRIPNPQAGGSIPPAVATPLEEAALALALEREAAKTATTLLKSYTLDPWSAYELVNGGEARFPALPSAADLNAAGASVSVQEALDRVMEAERLVAKLFEGNAPQLDQANAAASEIALRQALMAECEKATAFPYWRRNEAIFQAAIEGED